MSGDNSPGIEVTPEMVAVGVRVLRNSGLLIDGAEGLDDLLVRQVLVSALAEKQDHQKKRQGP